MIMNIYKIPIITQCYQALLICCCCCSSSVANLCLTHCDPMDCSTPGCPVLHHLKFTSIESVMPSNCFILCCSLLLLPSIFPSIRVFSNESALHIRCIKYWSFSFSISPSNEYYYLQKFMTLNIELQITILLFFSHRVVSDSFVTPWTVALQVSLCMKFPRQEYLRRFPFPSLRDLPDSGIKAASPAMAGGFFTTEPGGKHQIAIQ